jgi:hypothetical protein
VRAASILLLVIVAEVAGASGCLAAAQIVIGPTVDERGGVGGTVRFRVTAGMSVLSLLGSAEVAARQASPHTLVAGGLGLFAQVELPHDYLVMGNVRALLVGSTDWANGSAFGGALGVARYVKTKDELSSHKWHGWALGGELACDRQFGLGSRAMVLSPGFMFQYVSKLSD